jgi:hypothetical protein
MNLDFQNTENLILKCRFCDYTLKIPFHCKKQMRVVDESLICWKGPHKPCCNRDAVIDIPYHHEKAMVEVSKKLLFI